MAGRNYVIFRNSLSISSKQWNSSQFVNLSRVNHVFHNQLFSLENKDKYIPEEGNGIGKK